MGQKVAILLRRTASINRFRDIFEGCLKTLCIDRAVISSGFFRENTGFNASHLFDLTPIRCANPLELVFVGVYDYRAKPAFNTFVSNVQNSNCPFCVKVFKRMPKGLRWHAKTFIGSVNSKPRIGIIGSSNLTARAAGTSTPFNYEADVVLWYDDDKEINAIISGQLANIDNGSHEVIVTPYEQGGLNGNLSLENRLKNLEDEIISSSNLMP